MTCRALESVIRFAYTSDEVHGWEMREHLADELERFADRLKTGPFRLHEAASDLYKAALRLRRRPDNILKLEPNTSP